MLENFSSKKFWSQNLGTSKTSIVKNSAGKVLELKILLEKFSSPKFCWKNSRAQNSVGKILEPEILLKKILSQNSAGKILQPKMLLEKFSSQKFRYKILESKILSKTILLLKIVLGKNSGTENHEIF